MSEMGQQKEREERRSWEMNKKTMHSKSEQH